MAFLALVALPAVAQSASPKPTTESLAAQAARPAQSPVLPSRRGQAEPHFIVVLDPAHGGQDNGAMLSPNSPEKNYTLSLAIRMHVLLNARNIPSVFTRDSDTEITNDARTVTANRARAAACILLHATSTGNGVHLFTSSLAVAGKKLSQDPNRAFLPWQTAQVGYGTESLRLESDINAALAHQKIPVVLDRTSMMPLDSMACPAVAVEIAPLNADTPLSDMAYQEKVARALTSGLAAWRNNWKLQP